MSIAHSCGGCVKKRLVIERLTVEVAALKEQLAARERIYTPCPACGSSSLFVSDSGYLCCSLLGCPDPTRINNPREHEARLLEEMVHKIKSTTIAESELRADIVTNCCDVLRKEAAARRTK